MGLPRRRDDDFMPDNNSSNCCYCCSQHALFRRPRLLYAAVFVWISITGGRFTASFLEAESSSAAAAPAAGDEGKLNPSQIGTILAVQKCVGFVVGSVTGIWADDMERRYPNRGRLLVLGLGCSAGTLAFCFHGIHRLFSAKGAAAAAAGETTSFLRSAPWFVFLRAVYAICTSMVFPILDGICLDFLKKNQQSQRRQYEEVGHSCCNGSQDNGNDNGGSDGDHNEAATDGYGKERLYGAISWALANLMIGPLLDHTEGNFWVLYPMSIVSTVCLLFAIWIYIKNNSPSSRNRSGNGYYPTPGRLGKRDSNVILPDTPADEDEKESAAARENDTALFEDEPSAPRTTNGCDINRVDDRDSTVGTAGGISYYLSALAAFCSTKYAVAFMVCAVALSSGQAIVDDLVFLFFEFLGSSYSLMSMTVVLTVAFEIPIFQVAPTLLRRFGCSGLLIISSLAYVTRVVGYTFIPQHKPMFALALEPLHGVTYACSQTAAVDFVSTKLVFGGGNNNNNSDENGKDNDKTKNGNDGREATGQGFLQFFVGIGKVLGLVLGGYTEEALGPRIMYRISAFVVMIGCAAFVAVLPVPLTRTRTRHQAIPQTDEEGEAENGESESETSSVIEMAAS